MQGRDLVVEVAIVHDYLIQMGGAERVVDVLHQAFPKSPIWTSAVDEGRLFASLRKADIRTSWLQRVPGIREHFKRLFFLFPLGFRSLPPVQSGVAVINTTGFAKWMRVEGNAISICMCHTPPRFFWQMDVYLENEVSNGILRGLLKVILPLFRRADFRRAQEMDLFLGNSCTIQNRIAECYQRESLVVYPPVRTSVFAASPIDEGFYLIVSRLVAYKAIDLAVRAFTVSGRRLIIAGEGPDRNRLESLAGGNVAFLGRRPDEEIKHLIETCRAVVFPGYEDFGIVPVEANAAGKPVVAFRKGGATETIIDGETGVFFDGQTVEALNEAVETSEGTTWDQARIRGNALRFSEERFIERMRYLVENAAQLKREGFGGVPRDLFDAGWIPEAAAGQSEGS